MKTKLTQAQVKAELATLGFTFARTEHGEFRVNVRGGKETTAYYAADLSDALATGKIMAAALGGAQ